MTDVAMKIARVVLDFLGADLAELFTLAGLMLIAVGAVVRVVS